MRFALHRQFIKAGAKGTNALGFIVRSLWFYNNGYKGLISAAVGARRSLNFNRIGIYCLGITEFFDFNVVGSGVKREDIAIENDF